MNELLLRRRAALENKIVALKPITFISQQDGSTIAITKSGNTRAASIEYSIDDGQWFPYAIDTVLTLDNEHYVSFRRPVQDTSLTFSTSFAAYYTLSATGSFVGDGYITSLLTNTGWVDTIPGDAFYSFIPSGVISCQFNIPDTVTSIGGEAFAYCGGFVGNLEIPQLVTEIGAAALRNCNFTGKLILPESLVTIGKYAFYACPRIDFSDIVIPASVTTMGTLLFFNAYNTIFSITCHAVTPPTIDAYTFGGYKANSPIYVPKGSGDAYKAAPNWSSYAANIFEME
jgi:hypothetical protein